MSETSNDCDQVLSCYWTVSLTWTAPVSHWRWFYVGELSCLIATLSWSTATTLLAAGAGEEAEEEKREEEKGERHTLTPAAPELLNSTLVELEQKLQSEAYS